MTTRIRRVWEWWKGVAQKLGNFQARLILSILYYFVLGPFALIVRSLSDPLSIKPTRQRGWQNKVNPNGTRMEQAQRQS